MNKSINYHMKVFKFYLLPVLTAILYILATGCSMDELPDNRETEYGYVQFKVYKNPTKALDFLHDAAKLKVTMSYEGELISQTMVLSSYDEESSEYGLRSDKLKLLVGKYQMVSFDLYDKFDEVLYKSSDTDIVGNEFEIIAGGLNVHDLFAAVTPRGHVRFTLVKDELSFIDKPEVKAGGNQFTFDEIEKVDIVVRTPRGVLDTLYKLPTEFSIHFDEDDRFSDKEGYQMSSIKCDTTVLVPAGDYNITAYILYDADKKLLGRETLSKQKPFTVEDNKVTETDVPVLLNPAAEYLKDYYALYEIWKSLDGERWYYSGEDWPEGTNWDFNKDPDLWGDQPGVSLHANGRVAMIDISDFGFRGHLSPAISQLTELVELYLGTHNDRNLLEYDPSIAKGLDRRNRMERHGNYLRMLHTPTQFSEPIARALMENGKSCPEISLYEKMSEDQIIERGTGRMKIKPMDLNPGKLCNGLKSIPEEIKELTKLETFYVANGELESLPEGLANLMSCTDIEIYNCPKMETFPAVLAKMPALVSVNLSCNPQWNKVHGTNAEGETVSESDYGLDLLANADSRRLIQILYMNNCGLTQVPASVCNMLKIGLLDLSNNEISVIKKAFGSAIKPVQLYLDNNHLSDFPRDENGMFCGIEDIETFSVRQNNFTRFPDIFNAESIYDMASVDFSYNHISEFENAADSTYKGLNVNALTITNNPEFTTYPLCLAQSKSRVGNVNFRGCNINSIPKRAFVGENVIYLSSLDLSYNDLSDLPRNMHAGNMPYLYGVELSYNHFTEFPWEPTDSQYLTVFAMRGQRDAKTGERCFSDWPQGIYNHRGLRGLYLGSNDIRKVDDTISTICYYLDISDNPNIIFPAEDICYAIQAGAYILIYDKTQNITGCDILFN